MVVERNQGCEHQDDEVNTQSEWIRVPDGGGAAQHSTDVQHVKFAMTLTHPLALNANLNTSEEWWSAVKFETKSCHKVDAFRLHFVVMIQNMARQLEPERTKWLLLVPASRRKMMEKVHLPLIHWLCLVLKYKGINFFQDLLKGSRSIGHLGKPVVEM